MSEKSDDDYFSKSEEYDSDGDLVADSRINMHCKPTTYSLVKSAGKMYMDWHLSKRLKSDWDVAWFDEPIDIYFLKNIKPY